MRSPSGYTARGGPRYRRPTDEPPGSARRDQRLLDRVVPADQLLEEAHAYAQRICALPPSAVRVSKRAIRRASEMSFVDATRYESQLGSLTQRARADSKEARDSFLEKRKPRYTGR